MSSSAVSTPKRSRLSWRTIILIGLAVLLLGTAFIIWGVPPQVPRGPMHSQRTDAGDTVLTGTPTGGTVGGKATALQANTTFSSAKSTSSSDNSVFVTGTAAIFNQSDHLLMQRVGQALFRTLSESRFRNVDYYPVGHHPEPGGRLPDLLFSLDLVSLTETGTPIRKQIDVQIAVSAGQALGSSSMHYHGFLTPPIIEFTWRGDGRLEGIQTGIETSAEQYSTVANDLAKSISKQVQTLLDDLEKQFGAIDQLPDEFYPAYEPPPEFAFVKEWSAEKVLDGSAAFRPTDVTWRVQTTKPISDVIASVARELRDQPGWDLPTDTDLAAMTELNLHRKFGEEALSVVPHRKSLGLAADDKPSGDEPRIYFIHFVRTVDQPKLEAMVDALFQRDASETELLLVSRHWTPEQQARILERFQQRPPQLPGTWKRLAVINQQAGRLDEARESIRNGATLMFLRSPESNPQSVFQDLAKKLEIESELKQPDMERARKLGAIDLPATGEITVTARPNEAVILIAPTATEPNRYVVLTPKRRPQSHDWVFAVQVQEWKDGGHSRSWYDTQPLHAPSESKQELFIDTLRVRIQPADADNLFPAELTIRAGDQQ